MSRLFTSPGSRLVLAAAGFLLNALPASAANIVLVETGGFSTSPSGADALLAFQKAANYWNKTLSTDVTLKVKIGFEAFTDPDVLSSTFSNNQVVSVANTYDRLAATGNSALDATAVKNLRPLSPAGGVGMQVNGYADPANHAGIDTRAPTYFDNNSSRNNKYLNVNTSVVKALGLSPLSAPLNPDAAGYDASITFSSNFGFDFNPLNGISAGKYDFTAVAVHELGHMLGFVSGADFYDLVGYPKSPVFPGTSSTYAQMFEAGALGSPDQNDYAIGSTLDLFRYGDAAPGDDPQLQWSADRPAYFSIDGKQAFNSGGSAQQPATFSTGVFNGDGNQASHWGDNMSFIDPNSPGCAQVSQPSGIMDPTAEPCMAGKVTANDLAAFDALGWNLDVDVLADPAYAFSTAQIFNLPGLATTRPVPELDIWAQLAAGFGLLGGLARRRRALPSPAAA